MIKTLDEVLTDYEFVNIVKEKYPEESGIEINQIFDNFSNHCVFIADDLSDFSYSYSGKTFLAKKTRDTENGIFTEDQLKNLVAIHVFDSRDKPYEKKTKNKTNNMKNTIVKIEGKLKGEEFFNAQFCPTKEDVFKAMSKFFDFFMENNTPKSDLEEIIKGIVEHKFFNIDTDENNWMTMSFDKI